jgi:FSR family fosmidomycin resistance protein-like MFS transporter
MAEQSGLGPDRKAITALSAGHFVTDMFASALVPLYPVIAASLGIKLAAISVVISIGHLLSSAMQPLFGFLADQHKHRTFLLWGLAMGSVFLPLTVLAPNVWLLALFLILGMCGNSLFHPQATTLINVFNKKGPKITKYMGIFLGMGTIGYAISPVCSSFAVDNFGMLAMFYMTFLGLFCVVLMYFFVPKVPFKAARRSKESFFEIIGKIAKTPELLSLIFISVMKSVVTIAFATYVPFLLNAHGWTLAQTGLIMTCFFTFAGVATVLSSKIERIIGAQRVIKLSFYAILPMTVAFLLLLKPLPLLALVIFVLMGFFAFLSVSVTMCAAQSLMPEHRGVISGSIAGFSWSVAAISLVPFGFLAEWAGIGKILGLIGVFALLTGLFGINKKLQALFEKSNSSCASDG